MTVPVNAQLLTPTGYINAGDAREGMDILTPLGTVKLTFVQLVYHHVGPVTRIGDFRLCANQRILAADLTWSSARALDAYPLFKRLGFDCFEPVGEGDVDEVEAIEAYSFVHGSVPIIRPGITEQEIIQPTLKIRSENGLMVYHDLLLSNLIPSKRDPALPAITQSQLDAFKASYFNQ